MLPGWLQKAIRVTNFMKSFGPIEWVVGLVVVVVLFLLVRVVFAVENANVIS